jgi:hypothetical protein
MARVAELEPQSNLVVVYNFAFPEPRPNQSNAAPQQSVGESDDFCSDPDSTFENVRIRIRP